MSSSASSSFPAGGSVVARFLAGAFLASVLVGAPAANGQPDMTRGVYASSEGKDSSGNVTASGKVHFFEVGTDSSHQTVTHRGGTVDPTTWVFTEDPGTADTSGNVGACAPAGAIQRNRNAAVFGQTLVLAFVGWKSCDRSTGGTLFVISYDLTSATFGPLVALGATAHKGIAASGGKFTTDAATAAIVTFNDRLYVFSDSAAYTSGDGTSWTSAPVFALWAPTGAQPLDAIPYYPAGEDGRILVLFAYGSATNLLNWRTVNTYSWNGETEDLQSEIREVPTFSNLLSPTEDVAAIGLVAGTATPASAPGFTAGR